MCFCTSKKSLCGPWNFIIPFRHTSGIIFKVKSKPVPGCTTSGNLWDNNKKFLITHMTWEFLGMYVTDGIGDFRGWSISLGMYLRATRVMRTFSFHLRRWNKLAGNNVHDDRYMICPLVRFRKFGVSQALDSALSAGPRSWKMNRILNMDGETVTFNFDLTKADMDEHLHQWEARCRHGREHGQVSFSGYPVAPARNAAAAPRWIRVHVDRNHQTHRLHCLENR